MKFVLDVNETDLLKSSQVSFYTKQILGTIASCLICLCAGITVGISSVMLPQLRTDSTLEYNPDHDSWIASIVILSMIIGSLVSGPILDSYGRKAAHIILGVPFIIGWSVIACANSTTTILIGRFITGISSGSNKAVSLVYIGEIANPQIRAAALFLPGIITLLGILISHIIGYYLDWKLSAMIAIAPAVISLVIFIFLKESPLWLIAKGRTEEGIEIFRWFRGTNEASEAELRMVLERQSEKPKISAKETLNVVCTMAFIKPMLILMVVMLGLQLSGMNILRGYSQDVFENTFSGNLDPFTLTISMDSIRSVLSISVCLLQKFIPRKTTFITSCFLESAFIAGLVTCLVAGYNNFMWIPVFCLVMYICLSSLVIAIGWTFVPEVLPSTARGLGSGLNSAFSFLVLFVILQVTPDLLKSYGASALFAVNGISTLVCGIILFLVLPDTNGKTLQSIEDSYSKDNKRKSTS